MLGRPAHFVGGLPEVATGDEENCFGFGHGCENEMSVAKSGEFLPCRSGCNENSRASPLDRRVFGKAFNRTTHSQQSWRRSRAVVPAHSIEIVWAHSIENFDSE
jgi:hypothetical protein